MKKIAGILILLTVASLLSCPNPSISPTRALMVSTLAGTARLTGATNSDVGASQFDGPAGVAVDKDGNVYVADRNNRMIRKIRPDGTVSTLAGPHIADETDDDEAATEFDVPAGVAVDSSGNVYVADRKNHQIYKITPEGEVDTLAGTARRAGDTNSDEGAPQFDSPADVAVDSSGNVYVADFGNHLIRRITPSGVVSTYAGTGSPGDTNGDAIGEAQFDNPQGVAVDKDGNVYVADRDNIRIRKISPQGMVSSFIGTAWGFRNGDASEAEIRQPAGVTVDSSGNVYVADQHNHRIRKISPEQTVSTYAGTGEVGYSDGVARAAGFFSPSDVAVDSSGNVYVADSGNHLIRKIEYKVP